MRNNFRHLVLRESTTTRSASQRCQRAVTRRFTSGSSSAVDDVRNAVHELEDTVCLTRVRALASTLELPSAVESSFKRGSVSHVYHCAMLRSSRSGH